jgi:peptide deformylase
MAASSTNAGPSQAPGAMRAEGRRTVHAQRATTISGRSCRQSIEKRRSGPRFARSAFGFTHDPALTPAEDFMALMQILEYPDPRLKKVAQPVTEFGPRVRQLVADMAETMYEAPGIGLAATQVDVHERIIVIDVSETKDQLQAFINPEVLWASEETALCEEGCLSVPGIYDEVRRPAQVKVRAQDVDGQAFELDCAGLLAVCIQHEMDHLTGKVFVEYLSALKQDRIRTKMRKRRAA